MLKHSSSYENISSELIPFLYFFYKIPFAKLENLFYFGILFIIYVLLTAPLLFLKIYSIIPVPYVADNSKPIDNSLPTVRRLFLALLKG